MLRLARATPPTWIEAVLGELDTVLLDHAHCEKKAASTAINLIFRYPDRPALVRALTDLAREELDHFALMLDLLEQRGVAFGPLVPSPYAGRLVAAVRADEPLRLLDTLLCCALIEARSCERMRLLSEHAPTTDLRELYAGLLASEARHHHTYVDLARQLVPGEDVAARLSELAAHEATLVAGTGDPTRMHSAAPA